MSKVYRLYLAESAYIELSEEKFKASKRSKCLIDSETFEGIEITTAIERGKHPILIITPIDNIIEEEISDD